jgi:hypothetical protein
MCNSVISTSFLRIRRPRSGPASEGFVLTIYRRLADGKLWALPKAEFDDGRFEAIAEETKSNSE